MDSRLSKTVHANASAVSVVVPSYNHELFIEKCLQSIISQTFAPGELIVIDDGSRDGSTSVIERVLKSCSFPCELIARRNKGLAATLNEGLRRSGGRYFAYLGSDDLWLPQFLEKRVATLDAEPAAALAYGHAYIINSGNHILECSSEWPLYARGYHRETLLQAVGPLSPTVVYRRQVLSRYGWNESAKLEDYELYLRLSAEGEFAFDSEVLSAYRLHTGNTSRDIALMLNEWLDAQRRAQASLGLSDEQLRRIQTALKFRCAEDFARGGRKMEALRLMLSNLTGASSVKAVARLLIRLLAPRRVTAWRRAIRQRHAGKRYESLPG